MSSLATALAPCQYLFNQDAQGIFPAHDAGFINESLSTLMKIVDYLVKTSPNSLFLFDPIAFNNQCHLYTLFVIQAVREARIENEEPAKLSIDRRFLYHSFFLSSAFLTDPKLLDALACKTLSAMQIETPSKGFRLFLKDPGSLRTHASRSALNALFAEHMKKSFSSRESPLYPELDTIAQSDLQLMASNRKGTLYTFPKFAGVVYLIDALFQEKAPLIFKMKVVTLEGTGSFPYSKQNLEVLKAEEPAIVFEMVATGDSLSYLEYQEMAKQCPSYSQRNVSSKDRHKQTESCLACSPNKIDVAPYQERFQPILETTEEMLLALGADFVVQKQESFLRFFSDPKKFPQLTKLFETAVPKIDCCFLSMNKPLNMSVSHVYADCVSRARTNTLVMDAAYETHLKDRGLI